MSKTIKVILTVSFLVVLAILAVTLTVNLTPETEQHACTLEARICPDGSTVGREGPDCAFAPCPESHVSDEDLSAIDALFESKYIAPQEWPPIKTSTSNPNRTITCPNPDSRSFSSGKDLYCVLESVEGAAGSLYITYHYERITLDQISTLDFTIRFPVCQNYPESEQSDCERDQDAFDPDLIAQHYLSN